MPYPGPYTTPDTPPQGTNRWGKCKSVWGHVGWILDPARYIEKEFATGYPRNCFFFLILIYFTKKKIKKNKINNVKCLNV